MCDSDIIRGQLDIQGIRVSIPVELEGRYGPILKRLWTPTEIASS